MVTKVEVQQSVESTFKRFDETDLYKRWEREGVLSEESVNPSSDMSEEERSSVFFAALDELGNALREEGITLEELIESGREIRGEIFREKYARLLNK